jgi:hypothetical protein
VSASPLAPTPPSIPRVQGWSAGIRT